MPLLHIADVSCEVLGGRADSILADPFSPSSSMQCCRKDSSLAEPLPTSSFLQSYASIDTGARHGLQPCMTYPADLADRVVPGAMMSGLMRPSVVGPMDEKLAMFSHRAAAHAEHRQMPRLCDKTIGCWLSTTCPSCEPVLDMALSPMLAVGAGGHIAGPNAQASTQADRLGQPRPTAVSHRMASTSMQGRAGQLQSCSCALVLHQWHYSCMRRPRIAQQFIYPRAWLSLDPRAIQLAAHLVGGPACNCVCCQLARSTLIA